jgi:hypothetical protein
VPEPVMETLHPLSKYVKTFATGVSIPTVLLRTCNDPLVLSLLAHLHVASYHHASDLPEVLNWANGPPLMTIFNLINHKI